MKKAMLNAALILSMLIVIMGSVSLPWMQTNWPASNSFFNLYISQDKVFARIWDSLNGGRIFLTTDDGANWTQVSSADSDIDILSILMLNSNILAGTWDGFYLSTDVGTTWNAVTPTGIPAGTAIWSIAMIGATLFAGTTGDIYKSLDNGNTWIEVNSGIPVNARITSIVASANAIFAGSVRNGIFKTTDGGTSWTEINSGLADTSISQLVVSGARLFAVTLNGVFVSNDNGMSWAADASGLTNVNCFVVVNNQLFAGTDDSGVYLSVDNGVSWTAATSGMPSDTRVWSLAASSGGIFAGTSSGVWRVPISTANFTITATASEGGTISPEGNITVLENSSQTFTIRPTTGYYVSYVLVDNTSVGTVTNYTFTNVTADHTIAAIFAKITILGDANGDGVVNSTDALITLTCDAEIKVLQFCPMNCGDVNADGQVNSTDALIILSSDVGISVPFPVGQPGCPAIVTPCPGCNP